MNAADVIRLATEVDLPEFEWGGEFRHFRRLYREVYEGMLRGNAIIWVAERPGIGVISQLFVQLLSNRIELADGSHRAYIYGFRIKPTYRNRGLGTRMILTVEHDLHMRGFDWTVLNVSKDNQAAIRFYRRNGYQIIASEDGRWSYLDEADTRHYVHEPSWRMEKILKTSQTVNLSSI